MRSDTRPVLQQTPHPIALPEGASPGDGGDALARVEEARRREREARAAFDQRVHVSEQRYAAAGRRFQDSGAAFETRRSSLQLTERHAA
jgi:hypothetical protein